MQLRHKLVEVLSDGQFHSGQALGDALGVSRMAVWKHIRFLREAGVEMETVQGKGYRLQSPIEMLDAEKIRAGLSADARGWLSALEVLAETDSTNTWLRSRALEGAASGMACLAEVQHAGRGRRNRAWVSPFGANLYLSLLHRTTTGVASLGGLSLAMGVAITRCLESMQVTGLELKWPNDILFDSKKLAGILIEVVGESTGPCAVIIGIGINVNMPSTQADAIDQPWIDLSTIQPGNVVSRNQLAARLIGDIATALHEFESSGLQTFLGEWQQHDCLAGQVVDVSMPGKTIRGTACGIDESGALLIETAQGRERFVSGDVSVRGAT